MAKFFDEMDAIYCLCIKERKNFVMEQATKLGIADRLKIYDAFTPNSNEVINVVNNHLVYPILANNLVHIASALGMKKIMHDIVEHKYNFAMIMEDDVIFLEDMLAYGNTWLNRESIEKHFDVNKPYNLYLLSDKVEHFYGKQAKGIFKCIPRYCE